MATRPKRLTCSCCGETALGRQHWNQDTGYGLCVKCVTYTTSRPRFEGEDELRKCHGKRGYNFATELRRDCKPGDLVGWITADGHTHAGILKEWDNGTAIVMTEGAEQAVRSE